MKQIFVFGRNLAAVHGAGAARAALLHYGAQIGRGIGLQGNSYAIPTMDMNIESLPLHDIRSHVLDFLEFAYRNSHMSFQVTRIGCGLAGFNDEDIAPLFKNATPNCQFDTAWKPFLGDEYNYWGTF